MSEENQSNSKTDSAANGDCRPVHCSAGSAFVRTGPRGVAVLSTHPIPPEEYEAFEDRILAARIRIIEDLSPNVRDLAARSGIAVSVGG